jgi:hypothetical protein
VEEKPNVFELQGRIIRYVDADTLEIHPFILPAGFNLRVRLRDAWIVEDEDDPEEHARILKEQIAIIGDVGAVVGMVNTRHHFSWGRLEARLDPL